MKLFLCDLSEEDRISDFNTAQFVAADTPSEAAKLYRKDGPGHELIGEPIFFMPVVVRTVPALHSCKAGTVPWYAIPMVVL